MFLSFLHFNIFLSLYLSRFSFYININSLLTHLWEVWWWWPVCSMLKLWRFSLCWADAGWCCWGGREWGGDALGLWEGLGGGADTTLCGGGVIPGTGILGGGGEVGEEGAVLELDDVLLEDVLGVVVDDDADDTVELESDVPTGGTALFPLVPNTTLVLEIWCCNGWQIIVFPPKLPVKTENTKFLHFNSVTSFINITRLKRE